MICPTAGTLPSVAPEPKLSEADVKRIRRRVRAGSRKCDLAVEYGVNRKTISRRLAQLEELEAKRDEALAAKRRRRQVRREQGKLRELDLARAQQHRATDNRKKSRSSASSATNDPYNEWLDRPKNLSGRALAEARGLVRVISADGRNKSWVERADLEEMIEEGWVLGDS